ncbi:hypothetical protein [Rhodococcus triatomae]|nr:hypothetical protein G419_25227 [Rhodococcus triatomae BKS 15-14]
MATEPSPNEFEDNLLAALKKFIEDITEAVSTASDITRTLHPVPADEPSVEEVDAAALPEDEPAPLIETPQVFVRGGGGGGGGGAGAETPRDNPGLIRAVEALGQLSGRFWLIEPLSGSDEGVEYVDTVIRHWADGQVRILRRKPETVADSLEALGVLNKVDGHFAALESAIEEIASVPDRIHARNALRAVRRTIEKASGTEDGAA